MKKAVTAFSVAVGVFLLSLVASSCGEAPASPDTSMAVSLGSGAATLGAAGGQAKQGVCHFDPTAGRWTLLSVPGAALQAHLAQHDDAVPGGITPSGARLDATCGQIACPCFSTDSVVVLFQPGPPTRTLTWGFNPVSAFIHDLDPSYGPWLVESLENYVNGDYTWSCVKTLMAPGNATPPTTITRNEHNACVSAIGAAQVQLGLR
jgi:hypothetical protein